MWPRQYKPRSFHASICNKLKRHVTRWRGWHAIKRGRVHPNAAVYYTTPNAAVYTPPNADVYAPAVASQMTQEIVLQCCSLFHVPTGLSWLRAMSGMLRAPSGQTVRPGMRRAKTGLCSASVTPLLSIRRRCPRTRVQSQALLEIASVALTGQQAGLTATVLKPTLTIVQIFFIFRIVMSWDPQLNSGKKLPWSIFYRATEPILSPTRQLIKPIGGVDISPIVWTFVTSLMNELLLGPQGILILIEKQGGL
jgi:YggT family protein